MKQQEKIKLYVVLGLLVVAAVVAYLRFFRKGSGRSPAGTTADMTVELFDPAAVQSVLTEFADLGAQPAGEPVPITRNPFTPGDIVLSAEPPPEQLTSEEEEDEKNIEGQEFALKGIIWSGGTALARINDSLVKAGESVDGYTVDRIARDRVVLTSPKGRTIVLTIGPTRPQRDRLPRAE